MRPGRSRRTEAHPAVSGAEIPPWYFSFCLSAQPAAAPLGCCTAGQPLPSSAQLTRRGLPAAPAAVALNTCPIVPPAFLCVVPRPLWAARLYAPSTPLVCLACHSSTSVLILGRAPLMPPSLALLPACWQAACPCRCPAAPPPPAITNPDSVCMPYVCPRFPFSPNICAHACPPCRRR